MPKIDLDAIEQINRTGYPEPYAAAMAKRFYRRIAPAAGLTDFGVSHVVLKPGGISSQRHWHEGEDELVVMLSGEAVLIDNEGETVMRAGDVAFGKVSTTDCHYPDIDLLLDGKSRSFVHKDGSPYPGVS